MTPRRDVEGEIYAQLYGEPSEPEDPASTRVIDGDHRTWRVREEPEPEPEPDRPRALEALGLAAGARSVKEALRSTRVQGLRDAVRSTRSLGLRDAAGSARAQNLLDAVRSDWARAADGLGGRKRRLAVGALAVSLVGLVLIAGLSSSSGVERQRTAGPPPATTNQLAAESAAREAREAREAEREAREAREARRRRAQRRRAAAERRREERAVASAYQAPVEDPSPSTETQPTDEGCSEDGGCAPQSSPAPQPTRDDDDAEQSDRKTVDRPRVRTTFRYGRSAGGDRYIRDVDVDVREVD